MDMAKALRKARRACDPPFSMNDVDEALAAQGHDIKPGRTYSYESGRAEAPQWYVEAVAKLYGVSALELASEPAGTGVTASVGRLEVKRSIPPGYPTEGWIWVPSLLDAEIASLEAYVLVGAMPPLERGDKLLVRMGADAIEGVLALVTCAGVPALAFWKEAPSLLDGSPCEDPVCQGVAVLLVRDIGHGAEMTVANTWGLARRDVERLQRNI